MKDNLEPVTREELTEAQYRALDKLGDSRTYEEEELYQTVKQEHLCNKYVAKLKAFYTSDFMRNNYREEQRRADALDFMTKIYEAVNND